MKILKNILFSNSIYSLTGTILAGFFAYIFSFVLARQLTVIQFGWYQFFASVFVILGIFCAGITYFVIKHTAVFANAKDYQANYFFINKIFARIKIPLLVFFTLFLFIFLFCEWFGFYSFSALAIIGLSLVFSVLGSVYLGMFVGWLDFRRFAAVNILATLMRLLALILVFFYPSVTAATFSFLFAGLGNFLFGYWFSKKKWFKEKLALSSQLIVDSFNFKKSAVISALILSVFTIVIGNVDTLVFRFFLNADTFGHYSVLALLGRVPFFISTALIAVFLPKLCQAHNSLDKEKEHKLIRFSILTVSLINFFFIFLYYFFSSIILSLSFGKNYVILSKELWLVAVMYSLFSLVVLKANQVFSKF